MKKVAAVVVTFNRKALLIKNIKALLAQNYRDFDILIIDNASIDGTRECVAAFIDNGSIQYYNTGKNLGGAGGFNFGMRLAVEAEYEYIWLMDDDTIPYPDTLTELLSADAALKGNYGFLSSVALWKDGTPCKMNRQKSVKDWYGGAAWMKYALLRICHASFVSFFVKSSVVIKEGLPIKDFFIWGDDVEYSGRLAKRYNCYLVGRSQVLHDTSNNEGSNIARDDASRIERYKYAYRNEMYLAKKNGAKGLARQFAKICLHMVRVLVRGGHKVKKWSVILGSSFRGMFFNPVVEYVGGRDGKN